MEFTTISADKQQAVTRDVLCEGAVQAQLQAFAHEREAILKEQRCDALPPEQRAWPVQTGVNADGSPVLVPSHEEQARMAREEAERLAAKAGRKLDRARDACTSPEEVAAAGLNDEALAARKAELLSQWIAMWETEYLHHQARATEREATLALTGPLAVTGEERRIMEAALEDNKVSMATLDAVHATAVADLKKLRPQP